MACRAILPASTAPNVGVRTLRERLRYQSASQLAKRLGCDAKTVRQWARGLQTPHPDWRERMRAVLGIEGEWWELELAEDEAMTRPMAPVATRTRGEAP